MFLYKSRAIERMVKRHAASAFLEILSDPDAGLELSKHAARRLKKSIVSRKAGELIPFAEVLKRHGK